MLENSSLRVAFDPTHGHLLSLVDRSQDHEFVLSGTDTPLWSLVLDDGRTVGPQQSGKISWPVLGFPRPSSSSWTDFQVPSAPDLKVVATVSLEAQEPAIRWRIAVRGTGPVKVRVLHYPCLPGIARQDREVLAVPVWMGEKARHPATTAEWPNWRQSGAFEWSYPGLLSLQCLAFYATTGPGLMLSADDTTTARKHFAAFGDGSGEFDSRWSIAARLPMPCPSNRHTRSS